MPNTVASQNFDSGTDSTSNAMVATTILTTLLNIVFQGAMKELIGTILALQIIIHMFLLTIAFPGNSGNFV